MAKESWLHGDKDKGISYHKTPTGQYSCTAWLNGKKKRSMRFSTFGECKNWGNYIYKTNLRQEVIMKQAIKSMFWLDTPKKKRNMFWSCMLGFNAGVAFAFVNYFFA